MQKPKKEKEIILSQQLELVQKKYISLCCLFI